jgi:hypothetical protein
MPARRDNAMELLCSLAARPASLAMLARDLAGGDEAVILSRVDTLRLRDYPVTVDDSGVSVPRCAWAWVLPACEAYWLRVYGE